MKKLLLIIFLFSYLFCFSQGGTSNQSTGGVNLGPSTSLVAGSGITLTKGVKTTTITATNLATGLTGIVPIVNGGTNATTAAGALANLLNGQIVIIKPSGAWTWYASSANTDAARGVALQTAWTALNAGETIMVGPGSYSVTSTMALKGNLTVKLHGSIIYTTDKTLKMFSAVAVDGWSMDGGTLQGANNASSPSDYAIRVDSCMNFKIMNMKILKFMNIGIEHYGAANVNTRMAGQFSNLVIDSCGTGTKVEHFGEYNEFVNCTWAYCDLGVFMDAGNNRFTNCQILQGVNGIQFYSGGNNSHGTWVGGSINHNTGYAAWMNGNTNGWQFIGCDFYANNGSGNYIRITGAGSVRCFGGNLSSPIDLTGTLTTNSGFYFMRIPASSYASLTGSAANKAFVSIQDCSDYNGYSSSLNQYGSYAVVSFTPSIGSTSNVAAYTAYDLNAQKIGNAVDVWGRIDVDPTTTLTLTSFVISGLPFSTTGTTVSDAAGFINGLKNGTSGMIVNSGNSVTVYFTPADVTNQQLELRFKYKID